MKLDFNDPMIVAIASATLILHNSFHEKMQELSEDEYVYVPMRFPGGFYETLSSLMQQDQLVGSAVATSIFVAGLDSLIHTFNLRDSRVRQALRDAVKKHADEAHRECSSH